MKRPMVIEEIKAVCRNCRFWSLGLNIFVIVVSIIATATPRLGLTDQEEIVSIDLSAEVYDGGIFQELGFSQSPLYSNCWLLNQLKKENADAIAENSQVMEAILPQTGCMFLENHRDWIEKNRAVWQTAGAESLSRHWFFLAINPDVKSDDPDGEIESAVIGLYSTEEECHASMKSAQSDGLFTRQCQLVSDSSYLSCIIVDDKSTADCFLDEILEKYDTN